MRSPSNDTLDIKANTGSGRPKGPLRLVQPESAILVLFYDQAQRIYSLAPATGAIPIHQAEWEPQSMQTVQIADTETGIPHCLAFC